MNLHRTLRNIAAGFLSLLCCAGTVVAEETLPLTIEDCFALALGPGAETRRPMAIAVIGGMIFSTVLTLFVVPCAYQLLSRWERKRYGSGSPADLPLFPELSYR